jgi:hypothetical protein
MPDKLRGQNDEKRNNEMSAAPALWHTTSDSSLVLDALRNPKYKWRTIDGIMRDTELSRERVETALAEEKNTILRSSLPDRKGRALYTTADHYKAHSSVMSKVWSALSDQVR